MKKIMSMSLTMRILPADSLRNMEHNRNSLWECLVCFIFSEKTLHMLSMNNPTSQSNETLCWLILKTAVHLLLISLWTVCLRHNFLRRNSTWILHSQIMVTLKHTSDLVILDIDKLLAVLDHLGNVALLGIKSALDG